MATTKTTTTASAKLTRNQVRLLSALKSGKAEMSANDLRAKTGMNKGLSRVLIPMSEDGWIEVSEYEGDRAYYYTITAKGRKALDAHNKASK